MIQLAMFIVSTVIVIYTVFYGGILLIGGICWLINMGRGDE